MISREARQHTDGFEQSAERIIFREESGRPTAGTKGNAEKRDVKATSPSFLRTREHIALYYFSVVRLSSIFAY